MTQIARQKTGVADKSCVAMLCMVVTMLLGFTNTQTVQGSVDPVTASESRVTDALHSVESASPLIPPLSVPKTAIRPFSLAGDIQFGKVLGGVSSRVWLHHWVYSPDRVIADQRSSMVGKFHGIGFPDIRTHRRQKRSPFDAPGLWAPLVAWRTVHGDLSDVEPIARVRCMGLTPQAVARRADLYREMIYTYADKYDVSRHLVKAVITEESCFNNKALSPVGAQGLMQLMPDTANWLKVEDPHDPAQNLRAGVRYLASLRKEFATVELALAAYNAGPGNVRRYNGVPPFAETEAYVVKVQAHYRRYEAAHNMLPPIDDLVRSSE